MTEGLELNQLWSQFRADARASYRLYSRDYRTRAAQETRKRSGFQTQGRERSRPKSRTPRIEKAAFSDRAASLLPADG